MAITVRRYCSIGSTLRVRLRPLVSFSARMVPRYQRRVPLGSHAANSCVGSVTGAESTAVRTSTGPALEGATNVQPSAAGSFTADGQRTRSLRAHTAYTPLVAVSRTSTDFHASPAMPCTTSDPLCTDTAVWASSKCCNRTRTMVFNGTVPATVPL